MLKSEKDFDSKPAKRSLRIATYSRYSGRNQNPLSAQEQQDRSIKKFKTGQVRFIKYSSDAYDYDSATFIYFSDEAKSGTKTGRDGYDAFKKCIENGDCDVAIVDDLSRIVRDLGEQMDFYYLLKFTGVELYSVCDGISSEAPTAKIQFQIKGFANELERDGNADKTRRGLEARADKGLSCGDICFGYISVPTEIRNRGGLVIPSHFKIEIEVEQAKVVNFIYDEYIKGVGLSAIAKQLNKKLVPSPTRGQKITGKKYNWSGSTTRKILSNLKYIGGWDWGRTKTMMNPITGKKVVRDVPKDQWVSREFREDLIVVSKDKWDKVQRRFEITAAKYKNSHDKLDAVRSAKQIGSKSSTLLAGVLVCGQCGSPMLQICGQSGGFYGCYMNHRKDNTKCNNSRLLSRKKAEGKVTELIKSVILQPEYLESATKRANEIVNTQLRAAPEELKTLELKKLEIEREIRNLIKFITLNGDTSVVIKDDIVSREQELAIYSERIKTLKAVSKDKMLLTPFVLKAKFEKLSDYLEKDQVLANAYLRQIFSQGLKCTPAQRTFKKNHNQNNSFWSISGDMLVDEFLGLPKTYVTPHFDLKSAMTSIAGQV